LLPFNGKLPGDHFYIMGLQSSSAKSLLTAADKTHPAWGCSGLLK
jgi:hypothetical protein